MKNTKQIALALILALTLALVITACGGGNSDSSFSGTFVEEGWEDSGMSMVFNNNNTFSMVMSLEALGFGFYADGDVSLDGRYTVDNDAQTITISVTEASARNFASSVMDLITAGLQNDPDFADSPTGDEMLAFIMEMFEDELDNMAAEMAADMEDAVLTFDGNFDRLYLDGSVLVRR